MWFGIMAALLPVVVALAAFRFMRVRPDPDDMPPFVGL